MSLLSLRGAVPTDAPDLLDSNHDTLTAPPASRGHTPVLRNPGKTRGTAGAPDRAWRDLARPCDQRAPDGRARDQACRDGWSSETTRGPHASSRHRAR